MIYDAFERCYKRVDVINCAMKLISKMNDFDGCSGGIQNQVETLQNNPLIVIYPFDSNFTLPNERSISMRAMSP